MQRNVFWKTGTALVNASNDHLMGSASGLNFMHVLMVTPDDLNISMHRLKYIADIKGTARIFFVNGTFSSAHTHQIQELFSSICAILLTLEISHPRVMGKS